jgi:thioredoxin 1
MCKQQQPIVDRLSKDPRFAKVTVFTIDFDSGKEYLRQLKVAQQGTLIAFKGRTERIRSSGETDPEALRKVFEAAL